MAPYLLLTPHMMRLLPLLLKVIDVFIFETGIFLLDLLISNMFLLHLEGPTIENFQIIGDAVPGGKLLGCGYPVRGTSLCMFQVKFLEHSSCVNFHICYDILICHHCLRISGFVIFRMALESSLKVDS